MTAPGLDDRDKVDWYLKRAAKMHQMAEAAKMAEDYGRLADACEARHCIRR